MKRYRGFTLVEVVVALSLFAVVLVGIVFAVYRAYHYVQVSKLQLIAVNLTREGVEAVYNIRDTNRRKYSGEKDKYWLKLDPYSDPEMDSALFSEQWFYSLESNSVSEYALSLENVPEETYTLDSFLASNLDEGSDYTSFLVNFSGELSGVSLQDLMDKEATFYRIIRVFWLYQKDIEEDDGFISCSSPGSCDTSDPKELRFCVKVFYVSPNAVKGSSELCGILTNFLE